MPSRRLVLANAGGIAATAICGVQASSAAPPHRHARVAHHVGADQGGKDPKTEDASIPAETPVGPLGIAARWAFIIDVTTGSVLLQQAADDLMPPSSLTKMMTAYLVFAALGEGRLRLDQTLPVSERAWRMQGSKMFVPLGQQVAVDDLIRGMLIQSGNDACIVLAEGLAGSEEQFVVQMNKMAQQLGLTHTQFRNATGWPDPDHHMSARDVAMLALHLIRDYPQYYHFFSEKDYKYNNIAQGNRNILVDKGLADGLKTGHTDAGGFGLCASSQRGGRRIIVVLNGMPSSRTRAEEGERLLTWAFASFEDVHLLSRNEPVRSIPVWLGTQPTVEAASATDIVTTMPVGWRSRAKIRADFSAPVQAPVAAGQIVGHLTVSGTGFPDLQVPLVATTDVARQPLPRRAMTVLEHAIGGG